MPYTIHQSLTHACQTWNERDFVLWRAGEREAFTGASFVRLGRDAQALAAALIHHGFQGRHVMLLSENRYEYMLCTLAVSGYAGVCVAANPEWMPELLRQAVADTDIACILCSAHGAKLLAAAGISESIVHFTFEQDLPRLLREGAALPPPPPTLDRDALCQIYFSSGTSGPPKAVMLNQRNLFAGLENLQRRLPISDGDRCYLLLPLCHTYGGIFNFLYMLHTGARVYLSGGMQCLVQELALVQPTIFCGVPKLYKRFYDLAAATPQPQQALCQFFGPSIRALFCGGSPAQTKIRRAYHDAGLPLLDAYALTETASSLSIEYLHSANDSSVGTVFENIQVRIDAPSSDLPGEICVKGDNVFLGYYGDTVSTAAAFDADGFFRTGDLGWLDSENRLYIAGRKNRIFAASNGLMVNPAELEVLLTDTPDTEQITVFCKDGQVAVRFIGKLSKRAAQQAVDAVNEQVPRYMAIQQIELAASIQIKTWK